MGLKIVTQESSPYTVPTGARVLSYSFVGDTGGGTLTITNSAGIASDAVELAQGDEYGDTFPPEGRIILGGGAIFAWTGIARYAITELS